MPCACDKAMLAVQASVGCSKRRRWLLSACVGSVCKDKSDVHYSKHVAGLLTLLALVALGANNPCKLGCGTSRTQCKATDFSCRQIEQAMNARALLRMLRMQHMP